MASVRVGHWVGRLLMWVVLGVILTGCATFDRDLSFGSRMGLRPDEPNIGRPKLDANGKATLVNGKPELEDPCTDYATFTRYALDLKEAYRTRTTQNRMWIYVAGITGLGVAAASGALAAATAVAAGTLALLAISGGFTAASFATIDNTELANVYNLSANQIGTALADAEAEVIQTKDCAVPLAELVTAVSDARNELEIARTNSAAGALIRARAGLRTIQELSANPKAALESDLLIPRPVDPTQAPAVKGSITRIDTQSPLPVPAPALAPIILLPEIPQRIFVTVENVQFDTVPPEDIKLMVGAKRVSIDGVTKKVGFTYEVRVTIDPSRPDPNKQDYEPHLVVGKSRARIPNGPGQLLRYQ